MPRKTRVSKPKKISKPKKNVRIYVRIESPWDEKNYNYEMRNVAPGLKHKANRWGVAILKGLQAEFGNSIKLL